MKITRLRRNPRAPDHLLIEVDGARFASLPTTRVASLGLEEGRVLAEDQRHRLEEAVAGQRAYAAAVRMVTARPRAVSELLRRLRAKGHDGGAAAEAVGRLEVAGLLDDDEFARHFVRVKATRGLGPSRLLTELLRRGVERRVADRAIADVFDAEGIDPRRQATAAARKRLEQLRTLPPDKRFRRVIAYLRRRGHSGPDLIEEIREIVYSEPAA